MSETHKQCDLTRDGWKDTAWLPARFAVTGKTVKIKVDGAWQDGWRVVRVYPTALPSAYVIARSWDYMETRRASDI